MRDLRITGRTVLPVAATLAAALTLSGCGLFNKSNSSERYNPNAPDRTAARVEANVTALTPFQTELATTGRFTAILYDADGHQFFGPEVDFEGAKVDPTIPSNETSATYTKSDVPFAAGQTYSMAVQGHTATTPPAPAALRITAPVSETTEQNGQPVPTGVYTQAAGQGVTVSWTGGDPNEPVYIFVVGDPTSKNETDRRRLFVSDDPSQSPTDVENFGKPIPNTGQYTIPAQVTERVVSANGSTTTQTVNVFDNPNPTVTRFFTIYVIQRRTTVSAPIRFSVLSGSTATAKVAPTSTGS